MKEGIEKSKGQHVSNTTNNEMVKYLKKKILQVNMMGFCDTCRDKIKKKGRFFIHIIVVH